MRLDDICTVRTELRGGMAEMLFCEFSDVDEFTTFTELGLGSVLVEEFLNTLNARYGLNEDVEAMYEYPTLQAPSAYITTRRTSAGPA
jgi:hypothetical protein